MVRGPEAEDEDQDLNDRRTEQQVSARRPFAPELLELHAREQRSEQDERVSGQEVSREQREPVHRNEPRGERDHDDEPEPIHIPARGSAEPEQDEECVNGPPIASSRSGGADGAPNGEWRG